MEMKYLRGALLSMFLVQVMKHCTPRIPFKSLSLPKFMQSNLTAAQLVLVGNDTIERLAALQVMTNISFPCRGPESSFAIQTICKRVLLQETTSIEIDICSPAEPSSLFETNLSFWRPKNFDQSAPLTERALKDVLRQVCLKLALPSRTFAHSNPRQRPPFLATRS